MKNDFDINIHHIKIHFRHDFILFNNFIKNNQYYISVIKIEIKTRIIDCIKINVNINKHYFDISNFHNFEKDRNI